MAKLKPDYSLIRNGEPLPYWLPRLVSPDPATRQAAGDALEGMAWGLPSYSTDWDDLETFPDTQAQQVRFEAALRAALDAHDFPRAAFVADLCMYRLALHSVHLRSFDHRWARRRRHDRRVAQLTTRLTRSLDQANPNAVSGEDRERLLQLVPTYLENAASHPGDNNGGEAISGPGMASCRIMRLLGPYLVAAPVAVEALLDDSDLRREALESLSHAGPAGMPFAPRLIRDLDRAATLPGDQYWHFDAFQALGSIGQDDPGVVAAMISRLGHGDARIRRGAASVLREMDADVCGREREIVERLRPMIDRDNEAYDALTAVASVGRHIPEVRQYICHLAGPRPPQWHPMPGVPNARYDAVMGDRGTAINSMAYFLDHAEECVPVLIDALETFEEYDPDEMYHGPRARVAQALGRLGPAAAAAALPLARHLDDEQGDYPSAILDALAAMGPAAGEALPLLEAYWRKHVEESDLTAGPIDATEDKVGWTIQRLRGMVNE